MTKKLPLDLRPRVVVAGTRLFDDYALLAKELSKLTFELDHPVIVHGGQKKKIERNGEWVYVGADWLADVWAMKQKYTVLRYYADWETLGKSAGPVRNELMLKENAGWFFIAFHDGKSPGTADAIERAKKYRYDIKIVRH